MADVVKIVTGKTPEYRHEFAKMAVTVCAILGGTVKEGGPVALLEFDGLTGDARFLDGRGVELGSIRTLERNGRKHLLWEIRGAAS